MIAYTLYGQGEQKAIALHGLFTDGSCFQNILSALDPEQFSIAIPDIRGFGASTAAKGPYDINDDRRGRAGYCRSA